jgi:predicted HicB family RNase H-like nuclease
MMLTEEKKKLTLRINAHLIEQAKQYASQHDTSVSQLVETFLQELHRQAQQDSATPVLDSLEGILPPETAVDQYYDYLVEKYGSG